MNSVTLSRCNKNLEYIESEPLNESFELILKPDPGHHDRLREEIFHVA